ESRIRLRDLDADLGREASAVAAGVEAEMEEETTLPEAAPEAYKDFANPGRVLSIYDGQGGAPLAGAGLPGVGVGRAGSGEASTRRVTRGGEEWRLVVVRRRAKGGEFQVALAQPLARLAAESAILRRTMLVGIPLVVALAAAGGW